MTRGERRHRRIRAIERAVRLYKFESWLRGAPEQAPRIRGIAAKTRQACSCHGCGSKRRYEGPTLQERRAFDAAA